MDSNSWLSKWFTWNHQAKVRWGTLLVFLSLVLCLTFSYRTAIVLIDAQVLASTLHQMKAQLEHDRSMYFFSQNGYDFGEKVGQGGSSESTSPASIDPPVSIRVSLDPALSTRPPDAWERTLLQELSALPRTQAGWEYRFRHHVFQAAGEDFVRMLMLAGPPENESASALVVLSLTQPVSIAKNELSRLYYSAIGSYILLGLLTLILGTYAGYRFFMHHFFRAQQTRDAMRRVQDLRRTLDLNQAELQAFEEVRRLILASSMDGLVGLDTKGKIVFANNAAKDIFQYMEDEMVGQDVHALLGCGGKPGNGHSLSREQCPVCQANAKLSLCRISDQPFLRKDGMEILLDVRISPVRDGDNILGSLITFYDLSDLQDLQDVQKLVFESASVPFFLWNEDFVVQRCNTAAVDFFGAPSREYLLENWIDFSSDDQLFGPNKHESVALIWQRCVDERQVRFNWKHRDFTGQDLPCSVVLSTIVTRKRHYFFGCLHDLSDIKRYEQSLETERRLLQQIINASPTAMYISDANKCIQVTNPAAFAISGLVTGDTTTELCVDNDAREDMVQAAFRGNPMDGYPLQIFDGKGNILESLTSLSSITYNGKKCILAWVQNVTELVKARKLAEASTQAKSDFLMRMSHEIRTPVNAIMGMLHLMLSTSLTGEQRTCVEKSQKASRTLLGMFNDILDFSMAESGDLALKVESFNLADSLDVVAERYAGIAESKRIELLFDIAPNVPQTIIGDSTRFGQVVRNLVDNALKFTEEGEIVVRILLESMYGGKLELRIDVEDTGIGLTEEERGRLFSSFEQVDSYVTRRYGGAGVGLALSRQLVELMGGQIWVNSKPGKGSMFSFTIKCEEDHRNSSSLPPLFAGKRALVVDDNAASRELLSRMLFDMGLVTTSVDSGYEAFVNISANTLDPYHLVLVDWHMPGMDGLECAKRLEPFLTAGGTSPLILLGAYSHMEEYRLKASRAGFNYVISKPLLPSALSLMVQKALGYNDGHVAATNTADWKQGIQGARILLVEDNDINQDVAMALLEEYSVKVTVAENGEEALAFCKENDYDLVFMDVQMPVMDGLQATKEIRLLPDKGPDNLPIIAMTAHSLDADRKKSMSVGMNDHITKPIDPVLLAEVLRTWIKPATDEGRLTFLPIASSVKPVKAPNDIERLNLPGFDVTRGLHHVGGNQANYIRQLTRFARHYYNTGTKLRTEIAEGSWKEVARTSHTLKGVAATLGAQELALSAANIEQACERENPGSELGNNLERIDELLASACESIRKAFPEAEAPAQTLWLSSEDRESIYSLLRDLPSILQTQPAESMERAQNLEKYVGSIMNRDEYQDIFDSVYEFEADKLTKEIALLLDRLEEGNKVHP